MENPTPNSHEKGLLSAINKLLKLVLFLLFIIAGFVYILIFGVPKLHEDPPQRGDAASSTPDSKGKINTAWISPDTNLIPKDEKGNQIRYGRKLISNTSFYLGPNGVKAKISNGMNCQNCHLEAGTKPYGNNYSAVASTYPKFRERSGGIENIYKRVNDCFERSLNGHGLDSNSAEMQAIKAYIVWLGKDVKKSVKPVGVGIADLPYLDHAADAVKGKTIFLAKCISCHNADGQGKINKDGTEYQYPPLWGVHSYNSGAGLFRLSRFAGYIKDNMPQGATHDAPQLTDEEAWDLAAYVNSQPRPSGNWSKDWPSLSGKPMDHPFGPYADRFTESQHKFGPFGPIAAFKKKQKKDKK